MVASPGFGESAELSDWDAEEPETVTNPPAPAPAAAAATSDEAKPSAGSNIASDLGFSDGEQEASLDMSESDGLGVMDLLPSEQGRQQRPEQLPAQVADKAAQEMVEEEVEDEFGDGVSADTASAKAAHHAGSASSLRVCSENSWHIAVSARA